MEKILTITIPSYNVEKTLSETVNSMIVTSVLSDLEILIVDDGSRDNTKNIGEKYQQMYPNTIRCISKANGGHGSTINTGIKEAKGKYFKVVDGDDWLITENLVSLIGVLKNTNADVVFNSFFTVNDKTKEKVLINDSNNLVPYNKVFNFDDVCNNLGIQMHSLTIKTEILRNNNVVIDEHRFYVDAEYILLPIPYVQTILFLDYPLYLYRIFTEGQSMNVKNMQKNVQHHYDVVMRMVSFFTEQTSISQAKRDYIERRIVKLIEMQYQIYFSFKYSPEIGKQIKTFNKDLKEKNEYLYNQSMGKIVRLVRKNVDLFYPIARLREKVR